MIEKTLYAHQQRFIDRNPDRDLLVWETGTGKTVAACLWLNKRKGRPALVVCPKGIVDKWKRDLVEWGAKADVVSRDQVKKIDLSKYRALVLDEAQDFASPLFDKGRSQRAQVIYTHIKHHMDTHVLLLTATPIRSTPWNIHTLACYLGKYSDVRKFREAYFHLTDRYGRMHWEKNKGWQTAIRPRVEALADIVLMQDCADVPVQHHQVLTVPWTPAQDNALGSQYLEPAAEWHARHRLEQSEAKYDKLMEIAGGYRKVIVVCHYRSQIDDYVKRIGDERLVFVLDGRTPDQDKVIADARAAADCIFIIQASMGAGFDAAEFSVVVFASMSFKYVDYIQMKGRVKRINNLHENTFIHLLGGKCDKAVYATIQKNRDFDVHDYLANKEVLV